MGGGGRLFAYLRGALILVSADGRGAYSKGALIPGRGGGANSKIYSKTGSG